jgi:Tfp pilus assembly protein PilF
MPNRREQAAAHLQSGNRALAANDFELARRSLETAVALEPAWAEARCQLGRAQLGLGDRDRAEQSARMAIEADPSHAASAHFLGTLLCERERYAEALPWLQAAALLAPNNAQTQRDLGVVRLFLGDLDAARATLNRTLELDPLAKDILPTLVRMTRMDSGDSDAERLFALTRELAAKRADLPIDAQIRVLFALGKALEDRGDFEAAFEAYASGNAMNRATIVYDVAADEARLAAVERVFNAALFERLGGRGLGAASDRPIIIVGMPRSGTTLVEQIISAHPDVHGAGELDMLQHLIGEATGIGGSPFPDWATTMNEADLKLIGEAFLAGLPAGLPGQSRATLKRLENFEYLGILHLCLPNATLIHCRRDARDSSFSTFATLFLEKQDYSYTFEELARYWRAYDRLMGHWSRVLPIGRVLEVSYEGLVSDLESWTRRLLAHCRLDWDDACLRYYESKRPVRSASFAQVRQPIFTTSIGRWKPFARQLAPLFAAMRLRA